MGAFAQPLHNRLLQQNLLARQQHQAAPARRCAQTRIMGRGDQGKDALLLAHGESGRRQDVCRRTSG